MRLRSRPACCLLAAIAYLGIALGHFSAVLPAPATLLPENPHLDETFTQQLDPAHVQELLEDHEISLVHDHLRLT